MKFLYPSAFEGFLVADDKELQNEILVDIQARKEAEQKAKEEKQRLQEAYAISKQQTQKKEKKYKRENIVFKCNYCDGGTTNEQIGYAGVCSKDMIEYNIKVANRSWCGYEEERFVFGVFLVDETYEGDDREEGYVTTKSKYKIKLSTEEAHQILLWNFHKNPNDEERAFWGSGLYRYITDTVSAQILKAVAEIKQGTADEELAKEFLEYYC